MALQFEKSADTKVLINVLSEAKVGDEISYAKLSQAIGRDVRVHAYPSLRSARDSLLREKGFVFGVVTNEGLKRLNDAEIVEASEDDRKRMLRVSKKAIRKLSVVDFQGLSEEKKREHIVASAQFGALAMFSGKNATKKIASHVNGSKETLAIGETLKFFG
jgi:DNA-binding transcriptional ArsR family regulator